ncbi:hypothetical protein PybrP1_005598 [[Pythium] brassicae (nom. inval.)]|nr:hypothetical protein PybrP1_005598 [[Pythium] brassicae (nom. inval.)]
MHDLRFSSADDDDTSGSRRKRVRCKGRLTDINWSVQALRYLPDPNFHALDELRVSAFTFDENTTAASMVVQLSDVDAAEPACAPTPWSCEMDVVLEAGHGTTTLLSCAAQTPRHRVRVLVQTRGNVTLAGTLAHLNVKLSEVDHVRSADDRGTFGKEGLLVITSVLYMSLAKRQPLRGLAVFAPIDAVLPIPEDSRYAFRAQSVISALNGSAYVPAPDWYGTEVLLLLPNSASTNMYSLVAREGAESAVTTSRLFFARLDVRDRIDNLNAALRRMVYAPDRDFNSDGDLVNAIQLVASSSCTGGGSDSDVDASASIVTLWPWFLGVNDAPRVELRDYVLLPLERRTYSADKLLSSLLTPLADVAEDADLQLPSFLLRVEFSCFHCRLRSRVTPSYLREQLGLFAAVEPDLDSEGRVSETTTLTVPDLCNFGKDGTKTRALPHAPPQWYLKLARPLSGDLDTRLRLLRSFEGSDATATAFFTALGGGSLPFSGRTQAFGNELWAIDGTDVGAALALDIFPGSESSAPSPVTVYPADSRAYFSARGPDCIAFQAATAACLVQRQQHVSGCDSNDS